MSVIIGSDLEGDALFYALELGLRYTPTHQRADYFSEPSSPLLGLRLAIGSIAKWQRKAKALAPREEFR